MFSDFIDTMLNKLAIKFKSYLINKKSVKSRFDEYNNNNAKWFAYGACTGTPLEIPEIFDSWGFPQKDYSAIPTEYIKRLKNGTFTEVKIEGISKKTLEKIQSRFTYGWDDKVDGKEHQHGGYASVQDSNYQSAARPYLKTVLVYIGVVLALIGVSIWGINKFVQAQHLKQYWASINTPETYHGDGFTATFPCSGVTTTNLTSGSDLSSNQSSCSYFGGTDHSQIDIYTIEVQHYLSTKFNPSDEVTCGNPNVYTGSADTQTYYNETRTVDGFTIVICGKGTNPVTAYVQNGNTVYMLTALPSVEKTIASKLDNLMRGFQVTSPTQQ